MSVLCAWKEGFDDVCEVWREEEEDQDEAEEKQEKGEKGRLVKDDREHGFDVLFPFEMVMDELFAPGASSTEVKDGKSTVCSSQSRERALILLQVKQAPDGSLVSRRRSCHYLHESAGYFCPAMSLD